MNNFVLGAICMAGFIVGLFFLRFWADTRDPLFLYFAIAFWIFAGSRLAVLFVVPGNEMPLLVHVGRLLASLLILFAIVNKNRRNPDPHRRD